MDALQGMRQPGREPVRRLVATLAALLAIGGAAQAQTPPPSPVTTVLTTEADGTTTLDQRVVVNAPIAEVWQVLGAVKSEFGKFGEVLARLKTQLATASNTIESAEVRTRAMSRALKTVEALPAEQSARLLPPEVPEEG